MTNLVVLVKNCVGISRGRSKKLGVVGAADTFYTLHSPTRVTTPNEVVGQCVIILLFMIDGRK